MGRFVGISAVRCLNLRNISIIAIFRRTLPPSIAVDPFANGLAVEHRGQRRPDRSGVGAKNGRAPVIDAGDIVWEDESCSQATPPRAMKASCGRGSLPWSDRVQN